MSRGFAIQLKDNFAWTEDSVLVYTTHGCTIIQQGAYTDEEDPFFILLEFDKVMCVKSAATDCSPDIGIYPETKGASSISVLSSSSWAEEAHKKYTYCGTPKFTNRIHYVVSNHDVFHEILAESFTETKITNSNPNYEKIKSVYLFSKAKIVSEFTF